MDVIASSETFQTPTDGAADSKLTAAAVGAGGERSMPSVILRSVQSFRTQDEYVVVMKEDLADWLNELYDTMMTADDLFDGLETGILLCRFACTVDDVNRSRDVQCSPVVYRERGVEPGSFQARVNVAAFLTWCRRPPMQLSDDLLFETGDLICQRPEERNERQVALCLLEVGRRSAGLGLPAPQLVRLEAEIDAEMRADDAELTKGNISQNVDVVNHNDRSPSRTSPQQLVNIRRRSSLPAACRTTTNKPSRTITSNVVETSITEDPGKCERRGSVWQRHRDRPIIPVDMMSLDEMVREILSRCTCPNQYPMIRVSEGKYRIGHDLTLIFVRILRNHVMVRIGGGWNTLDNYLARCDPCRCRANSISAAGPVPLFTPRRADKSSQERLRLRPAEQRLNSSCGDLPVSSSTSTETARTVNGSSQRQSGPSLMSQVHPAGSDNCRYVNGCCQRTTTHQVAERWSDAVNNDSVVDYQGSQYVMSTPPSSDHDTSIISSPSTPAALAVDLSAQADRDVRGGSLDRSLNSRPSRIPIPLRIAAQYRSANVIRRPSSTERPSSTIGRCDSGVDLNLSSPDLA